MLIWWPPFRLKYMTQENLPFKVVKKWRKEFYSMPNAFLNGYCKIVGWQGHIVYSALWRHADNGSCFPSLKHLAVELGVSVSAVRRGIKKLREYNIIAVVMRTRTRKGRGSNTYYLLHKSEWKAIANWSNQGKEYKPFKGIEVNPKSV